MPKEISQNLANWAVASWARGELGGDELGGSELGGGELDGVEMSIYGLNQTLQKYQVNTTQHELKLMLSLFFKA